MSKPWVVLKFGGTSVSTVSRWGVIADRVRAIQSTHRVWIVASALSQVSNRLERAIDAAVRNESSDAFEAIAADHATLADALGLEPDQRAPVEDLLADLERLLAGIRLTAEASPRLRARVMSFGELASTRLGVAALESVGVSATWADARALLQAEDAPGAGGWLSAPVRVVVDPSRAPDAAVVLTQGFIARNPAGETVLLGRGGSDTSATLFGALLNAERVEIWTDVHGMFTADPREIPTARLLRELGYREAQELAAMGAKVLHPRCLQPAAEHRIPLWIKNSNAPDAPGTSITRETGDEPTVTAVVRRSGATLVTVQTLSMWGVPGFLAKVFASFALHGISVDLVATSQAAVSVTLDDIPGGTDGRHFARLLDDLRAMGEVRVVVGCGVVSIVGRRIRAVLHELGGALAVFREHAVHLVSDSSEDLNLSFVVDGDDAARLTSRLHDVLFPPQGHGDRLGPTWQQLGAAQSAPDSAPPDRWWTSRVRELEAAVPAGTARYVYDLGRVTAAAVALRQSLTALADVYYAMKANPHPEVIRVVAAEGFGLECVSIGEIRKVRAELGPDVPVLFTPNFCPVAEYAEAFELGAEVTIDGPEILEQIPETFRDRRIAVRIDPGGGAGHHEKVVTAGTHAKFGHPAASVDALVEVAARIGATVTGLHAHVGSGILDPGAWMRTGGVLVDLAARFPDLQWVDIGGGLGVVERPSQRPLDLARLNDSLSLLAAELPAGVGLRMEPGRYLVSEAGVLAARVTQVRQKGSVRFVGIATGMNSLLRPALYGAWHAIHNASRMGEAAGHYAHVVGPICETGDVLGRNRLLPETSPGDLLVIENAGAYGHAMSSHYNDRPPASVVLFR